MDVIINVNKLIQNTSKVRALQCVRHVLCVMKPSRALQARGVKVKWRLRHTSHSVGCLREYDMFSTWMVSEKNSILSYSQRKTKYSSQVRTLRCVRMLLFVVKPLPHSSHLKRFSLSTARERFSSVTSSVSVS